MGNHTTRKKNPLRNNYTMLKLNPFGGGLTRSPFSLNPVTLEKQEAQSRKIKRTDRFDDAEPFHKHLLSDSVHETKGCKGFRTWLGLYKANESELLHTHSAKL